MVWLNLLKVNLVSGINNKQKMTKILNRVWSESAVSFMNVVHTSQKKVLHPTLANLINEQNPINLLDYGCGDGRILQLLKNSIKIDVHDINKEMLELALLKSGEKITSYFINREEIPQNKYDAILLSMVLVCIDNEKEYLNILKTIKSNKTQAGKVYIAVTHPCFRDRKFSNFHTSYSNQQPFFYLKEGEPFDVFIEDKMPPSVAFTDFHWSLSFTLNMINESGLTIEKIIETPDDGSHIDSNAQFSTFLIIIAK